LTSRGSKRRRRKGKVVGRWGKHLQEGHGRWMGTLDCWTEGSVVIKFLRKARTVMLKKGTKNVTSLPGGHAGTGQM